MKKRIEQHDIKWKTNHNLDEMGKCFTYDGRFYRLIYAHMIDEFRSLLNCEFIKAAIDKRLLIPAFEVEDMELEGYEECLLIEHPRLPYVTENNEWSQLMLYSAMSMVINLELILLSGGYGLADPHCNNIAFDGNTPVYLDWGSIRPLSVIGFTTLREIRERWMYPYLFWKNTGLEYDAYRDFFYIHTRLSAERYSALVFNGALAGMRHRIADMCEYRMYDNTVKGGKLTEMVFGAIRAIRHIDNKKVNRYMDRRLRQYLAMVEHDKACLQRRLCDIEEATAKQSDSMFSRVALECKKRIEQRSGRLTGLRLVYWTDKNSIEYVDSKLTDDTSIIIGANDSKLIDRLLCSDNKKVGYAVTDVFERRKISDENRLHRFDADILVLTCPVENYLEKDCITLEFLMSTACVYSHEYVLLGTKMEENAVSMLVDRINAIRGCRVEEIVPTGERKVLMVHVE
ncbi:MAG: hypothetical protein KBT19_09600 [Lachnospiraceae bacterium]|nr:hypothetical protein [Candidatus Colinaster equi]